MNSCHSKRNSWDCSRRLNLVKQHSCSKHGICRSVVKLKALQSALMFSTVVLLVPVSAMTIIPNLFFLCPAPWLCPCELPLCPLLLCLCVSCPLLACEARVCPLRCPCLCCSVPWTLLWDGLLPCPVVLSLLLSSRFTRVVLRSSVFSGATENPLCPWWTSSRHRGQMNCWCPNTLLCHEQKFPLGSPLATITMCFSLGQSLWILQDESSLSGHTFNGLVFLAVQISLSVCPGPS